jgi:hypothetical protein
MKTLAVIHTHEYGNSVYTVNTTRNVESIVGWYGDEQQTSEEVDSLLDFLEIYFEPEKGETLDITVLISSGVWS